MTMDIFTSSEYHYSTAGFPFPVVYPYHTGMAALVGLEEGRIRYKERKYEDVFDHPTIDLNSLFHKVRDTRTPLSEDESTIISEMTEECNSERDWLRARIAEIMTEIVGLCRTLTDSTFRLDELRDQAALGDYLISQSRGVWHRIPDEVLAKIFINVGHQLLSVGPSRMPLTLASVCHQWRSVALSTPQLWRNIYLDSRKPNIMTLAKAWISRTTSIFLIIDDSQRERDVALQCFLESPEVSSIRIQKVYLSSSAPEDILSTILDHNEDLEEISGQLAYESLASTSRLNHTTIQRLYLGHHPGLDNTLRVLVIASTVPWPIVELTISRCLQLETFYCRLQNGNTPARPPPNEIPNRGERPSLVYLGFVCSTTETPDDFLHSFSFPNLRILEHDECTDDVKTPWFCSHPLARNIRRLTLYAPSHPPESVISTLQHAPSLEELTLDLEMIRHEPRMYDFPAILATRPIVDGQSFPNLKRLHLILPSHLESPRWISALVQAWDPTSITPATIEDTPTRRRLTHLTLSLPNQGEGPREAKMAALIQAIRSVDPDLVLRIVRHVKTFWMAIAPSFKIDQRPFYDVSDRYFEFIIDEDTLVGGKWVEKEGSLYHVW